MLKAANGNILQENVSCVLTSLDMVALLRVMTIFHFKIALPMRWKAIDVLHDALVKIEDNGELFLDEQFMTDISSEIDEDEQGKRQPLEPLKEAMGYYMGE